MAFKDYNQVREPLQLPINGKLYTIPPVSIDGGVRLTDALDPNTPSTIPDEEFNRILLGDVLDEFRADHVTPAAIIRASMTALADWQRDRATAEVMWETGGDPKAVQERVDAAKNRAQRRSTSTTTAAASTTRKAASTTGTSRSRKK